MSLLTLSKRILGRDEQKQPEKKGKKKVSKGEKKPEKKAADVSVIAGELDLHIMITEQSMRQNEQDTVVFRVRPHATKQEIAAAVTEKYGVRPLDIRTALLKPKSRRRGMTVGKTSTWKKAYVKVDDVQNIISRP